ncbi:MAG: PKD domain-containing protein, partial [Bacteroidota bacterium]
TTFCLGNSVDLTSSYVGNNVWSTSANTDAITINAVGNYSIDVTYTDVNGCSSTSSPISVTVNALPAQPVITASGPTTFCLGNSVDLTSSFVGNNVWSTTETTDLITINALGTYSIDVTYTDANGCSATSSPISVTVNALPAPPVITASGPTSFCLGNSVDLTSSYVGGNVWSTTETTDLIAINALGNYNIDVTYTDANGCSATSSPISVTVNALPAQPIITAFGSLVFCSGSSVTLASNEASGNTWSTAATSQSIVVGSSGNYSVTYTDANGCSQTSAPVFVQVNTPTSATLNLIDDNFCESEFPSVISAGSPNGGNYIGSGIINNILYPALLPVGVYTMQYITVDANGCSASASQTYTITAAPAVSLTAPQTIFCLNDAPVALSVSPLGGIISGVGVVGNTFNPSVAGLGIHTLQYEFADANGCSSTTSLNMIVNPLVQLSLSALPNLCANSGNYSLNNGFPAGGTYFIDGLVATEINTSTLSAGIHTLTYELNPPVGCGNSISAQFTINSLPSVSFNNISPVCETASPILLNAASPAGGLYIGTGVIGGVFYPSLTNAGNNIITYSYTDNNGCTANAAQIITVLSPQPVTFTPLAPICINSTALVLNNALPAGGIYTGNGVVSGSFDPAIAGVGNHLITYTVPDINSCSSSVIMNITVNELTPLVSLTLPDVCSNGNAFSLAFAQPFGGVYTGIGVSNGNFDPSLSGSGVFAITYTYTDVNACVNTTSQNITVNPAPAVTHTNYTPVCEGSGLVNLNNGIPSGGIYSGNFVSNNQFNSSISGSGTFAINYVYTDANGCQGIASADLTVNPIPLVTLSPLGNVCDNITDIDLSNGFPIGGTYFGAGVSGDTLNPSLLSNGNQILGYTYTSADGCVDTALISYNVYTFQAAAGIDQSITCTTSTLLQAQSNYVGTDSLTYTWSPAVGLGNPNGQLTLANPSSSTNYVITISDGQCVAEDTVLVSVASSNFNLSVTPSVQLLNAPPFIVLFTNNTPNPSNYSFVWDFGDGTTYNGFQPVYHDYASNGIYTVTLIATALGSGCIDTLTMSNLITCNNGVICNDSINIYVNGVIVPNNIAFSTAVCQNQNIVLSTIAGPNANYQWYFNGLPIQAGVGSTYLPTVSGYYAVAVEDSGCVILSNDIYVTVFPAPPLPFISSAGSTNFCGGGALTLTANTGYTAYLWSTGSTQSNIVINTSGTYWVQGFDANGCYSQSLDYSVNGSIMLPQYICLATVDTALNKNRVIWEKPITNAIDSFVVYRESVLAGVYNEIGRVAYQSPSEFVDVNSFPSTSNNRYRLAILDTCGNLTTQGDIHATIKSWIVPFGTGDSLEVFFTRYVGINSLSYTLYRGPSPNDLSPVGNAYTFNNNANIHSIKDFSPPAYPSGYIYYQVRANLIDECSSDVDVYQQSISNTVGYGNALGIENIDQALEVNIYPNPNNGAFNVAIESGFNEDIKMMVYNQIGEIIWSTQLENLNKSTTIYVPLEQSAQGVYHLSVAGSKSIVNKKIIINK